MQHNNFKVCNTAVMSQQPELNAQVSAKRQPFRKHKIVSVYRWFTAFTYAECDIQIWCSKVKNFSKTEHWHSNWRTLGCVISLTTHTHTYIRLTALFPGLPRWAGTRKVEPIWILLKQETVSGSGISWDRCKSAPCSRQITTPASHHSVFYRPDALPAAQPTASKHWRTNKSHKVREISLLFQHLCGRNVTCCRCMKLRLLLLCTNSHPAFVLLSSVFTPSNLNTPYSMKIITNNKKCSTTYNAKQNAVLCRIVRHAEHRSPVASDKHTGAN